MEAARFTDQSARLKALLDLDDVTFEMLEVVCRTRGIDYSSVDWDRFSQRSGELLEEYVLGAELAAYMQEYLPTPINDDDREFEAKCELTLKKVKIFLTQNRGLQIEWNPVGVELATYYFLLNEALNAGLTSEVV
jgi:hypothetical protein